MKTLKFTLAAVLVAAMFSACVGPKGDPGPQGATGSQGPQGPSGVTGTYATFTSNPGD